MQVEFLYGWIVGQDHPWQQGSHGELGRRVESLGHWKRGTDSCHTAGQSHVSHMQKVPASAVKQWIPSILFFLYSVCCKSLTLFLLLFYLKKKSSSENVIISAEHNKYSFRKQTQLIIALLLFPCVSLRCHALKSRQCPFGKALNTEMLWSSIGNIPCSWTCIRNNLSNTQDHLKRNTEKLKLWV